MSLRFPALLLAFVACTACTRPATQLLVVVESDLPAARRACVHVSVSPVDDPADLTEQTFHVELDRPTRVSIPFSFGVTAPDGDASRRVELRVSALPSGAACEAEPLDPASAVVTRRVRSGFLPGQMLRLPVFLSSDCDGVICSATETCDFGSCIPVPEVDPGTLVITRPGTELLDAGGIDAALEDDAGMDAGVDAGSDAGSDAGADARPAFRPTRPAILRAIDLEETSDPHALVYPVGTSLGAVIVAGVTEAGFDQSGVAVPGLPIPDAGLTGGEDAGFVRGRTGRFFLAKLSATPGSPALALPVFETDGPPYPVVRRVLRLDDASGYVICGTASTPFYPTGTRESGGAARWGFVARLDPMLAFVPGTFHVLDASRASMGLSPELWCQDLTLDGDTALVAARVWGAEELRVDSAAVMPAAGTLALPIPGMPDSEEFQSLLLYEIRNVRTSFDVQSPVVVGHAPVTMAQRVGLDGVSFFVRAMGDGSEVLAAEAESLQAMGATRVAAPLGVWIARPGVWPMQIPVVFALPARAEQHLRALAASPGALWLAVAIQVGMSGGGEVAFNGLAPIPFATNTTFLLRIDPTTGATLSATPLPEGREIAGANQPFTSPTHARGQMLYGHGLTLSADGHALLASSVADGERVGGVAVSVTGMPAPILDPLLAIVQPDGAPAGIWQWDETTFPDWRLTHVEWMSPSHVAVAGYVEDEAAPAWQRRASFFHIVPVL